MTEAAITLDDIAVLTVLANGIIPQDARDAGAAAVHAGPGIAERARHGASRPVYVEGLITAAQMAQEKFGRGVSELNAAEVHELLGVLGARGSATVDDLKSHALLETIYRKPHVTTALTALRDESQVIVEPKRIVGTSVVRLAQ